jgi:sortase A
MNQLRYDILSRMKRGAGKVRKSRHFWPAIVAVMMVLAIGFVQFNGVIFAQVANFVSPGSTTGNNIIVGTGANQPVGPDAQVIIPKINVQAPVQYNLADLSETGAQTALQNGTIHYPIVGATAFPGQRGNTVVLGHSSADWFEPGNFKFIFVQLNRLSAGDLFYLDYQGTRYTYRISRTQIIAPNQLGALNLGTDKPYATLITCDPPGTALNRLLIIGEQISPDPNAASETQGATNSTAINITGTPPTLIERIFGGK